MRKTFNAWLEGYLAFRKKAGVTLGQRLSSEQGELMRDSQDLEPLRWEAEEHRAMAEGYYYEAKERNMTELLRAGWSKSPALEAAKAKSHRELWARENTAGICKAIESRAMKVAQHLKLIASNRP